VQDLIDDVERAKADPDYIPRYMLGQDGKFAPEYASLADFMAKVCVCGVSLCLYLVCICVYNGAVEPMFAILAYMCVCIYVCIYVCVHRMYVRKHMHTNGHTQARVFHMQKYMHTYDYTHTKPRMQEEAAKRGDFDDINLDEMMEVSRMDCATTHRNDACALLYSY
jgi:hypothetical protein